jgi:hypothetical protein
MGKALEQCLASADKPVLCKQLQLIGKSKAELGPTDRGPGYWSFTFSNDTRPKPEKIDKPLSPSDVITISVTVSATGDVMSDQEALDALK